VFFNVLKCDRA